MQLGEPEKSSFYAARRAWKTAAIRRNVFLPETPSDHHSTLCRVLRDFKRAPQYGPHKMPREKLVSLADSQCGRFSRPWQRREISSSWGKKLPHVLTAVLAILVNWDVLLRVCSDEDSWRYFLVEMPVEMRQLTRIAIISCNVSCNWDKTFLSDSQPARRKLFLISCKLNGIRS